MKSPRSILNRGGTAGRGSATAGGLTAAAPIAPDLAQLRQSRERLTAKAASCAITVEATLATRRHLLVTGSTDAAALRRSDEAVLEAESQQRGIQDALRHVDEQITAAERAHLAAVDQVERDRVATELEARAERITKAAAQVDRAAEKLDEARKALVEVSKIDTVGLQGPADERSPLNDMLRGAAAISGISPLSETERALGFPECCYGGAHRWVERLTSNATAIRAGEAPAFLPTYAEPEAVVRIPDVRVTLCRPVSYGGIAGTTYSLLGEQDLPEPVAKAAIAAGIGFNPGSREAKNIALAQRRMPGVSVLKQAGDMWVLDKGEEDPRTGRPVPPETWLPLPVNLPQLIEAERVRLRAAR